MQHDARCEEKLGQREAISVTARAAAATFLGQRSLLL